MTIKSFCRTFFKKFVGFRGKAPDGIFKGEALKLLKIKPKFALANFDNNDLIFNRTDR